MSRFRAFCPWVAGMTLLTQVNILACKCLFIDEPSEAFAQADILFAGTVIEITPYVYPEEQIGANDLKSLSAQSSEGNENEELVTVRMPLNRITLRVIETWKGTSRPTQVLLTGLGGGDCGYVFSEGSDYVIYAYKSDTAGINGFTSSCSRNSLLSAATLDLQFLGAGRKPDQPVLNILRTQRTTKLSWLTNWTTFRLEATPSLQPPLLWQPVSNQVATEGDHYVVTNEINSSRLFFRLVR
jgi:hypothetical protein